MPLYGPNTIRAFDNLHVHLIQMLHRYHDDGRYLADVAAVSAQALACIDAAPPDLPRAALVLDIDETSLASDWATILREDARGAAGDKYSYYDAEVWNKWVQDARAKALQPTLDVYRRARERGWAVFFITGRNEKQRAATEKNLREVGFDQWAQVVMRAESEIPQTAATYKLAARWRIAAAGFHVVVNVGDQASDLSGDAHGTVADHTFKLPNPFYFVA
jgi:acid phosphatase